MTTNVPVPPSGGGSPLSLSGDRLLRGTIARWTETTGWTDRDGLPLPETMFVIGYTTVLQRWKDKKPEYDHRTPASRSGSTQRRDPGGGMGDRPGRQADVAVEAHLRDLPDRPEYRCDLHVCELDIRRQARLRATWKSRSV